MKEYKNFERFVRTNGKADRMNKFSFELLRDKDFRKSVRLLFSCQFGKPCASEYYDFLNTRWADECLLENINKYLYIYTGTPGCRLKLTLPGLSNFRLSTTNEVDGNGKPKKYTIIAYTKDGHKECRKSASKLYIEAYKYQSKAWNRTIPDKVLNRAAELFALKWEAYAKLYDYTLNIDTDFESIYEVDKFGSCMTGEGNYTMYNGLHTMGEARACYLTNVEGDIVARAILWTNAKDENGKSYRLLDRCYSLNSDVSLQQVLIDTCIAEGKIDLYKPAGCSCHDNRNIKNVDGSDFKGYLHTYLNIDEDDRVSYMDTFVFYNKNERAAYNYECDTYTHKLDTTCGRLEEPGVYSEYYDEYIDEDDATWCSDVDSYVRCDDEDFYYYNGETYQKSSSYYCEDTGNYYPNTDGLYYCDENDSWYEYDTDLAFLEYKDAIWLAEDCVWSTMRGCNIAVEDAIYITDLHDYDLADNEGEYECTMDARSCYVYNSKREEE